MTKDQPSIRINPTVWSSPVPQIRWAGFRSQFNGIHAFANKDTFENAQLDELRASLSSNEKGSLSRLLERGHKTELEVFIRTRGCNPIFDPEAALDMDVGIARADHVSLLQPSSQRANEAVLNGDVVHVLFQAGEASRFNQGPFYDLNPVSYAQNYADDSCRNLLTQISNKAAELDPRVRDFLVSEKLGPKQPLLIRAALRRIVQDEINSGRIAISDGNKRYLSALQKQKFLFFVSLQGRVSELHDEVLRKKYGFFGFNPEHMVTIEQDLIRGATVTAEGDVQLLSDSWAQDAAGHMYALLQAVRPGDFITYFADGTPVKTEAWDALEYLAHKGAKMLSVIRINDMDRHSTEIINTNALEYALSQFSLGYANVIESVSNPDGQKGGTGLTFGQLPHHFLTETHENSFPVLSRAVEAAMKTYREIYKGQHPAYNAMRQWADLQMTRRALKDAGGRLVFVPRQKEVGLDVKNYIGVDMPMGDLSLLAHLYPSRMFQFIGQNGKELRIHDMKQQEHLPLSLMAVLSQLQDIHVLNAVQELLDQKIMPFSSFLPEPHVYSAPAPELN